MHKPSLRTRTRRGRSGYTRREYRWWGKKMAARNLPPLHEEHARFDIADGLDETEHDGFIITKHLRQEPMPFTMSDDTDADINLYLMNVDQQMVFVRNEQRKRSRSFYKKHRFYGGYFSRGSESFDRYTRRMNVEKGRFRHVATFDWYYPRHVA